MESTVKLDHIGKEYDAGGEAGRVSVLRDVSLELGKGESAAVIGPSGSGKTTLLNIIGTLDRPTSGRIWLEGDDLSEADDQALTRIRNQKLGFIFQLHHLLPQCAVLENVLIPTIANPNRPPSQESEDRAKRLLDRVGLGSRLSHRPGQLSGGERQRAAFVRALINQPSLILADEPTGSLDQANAEKLMALLTELNQEENTTMILVTHALDLAKSMRRTFQLTDGTLAEIPS